MNNWGRTGTGFNSTGTSSWGSGANTGWKTGTNSSFGQGPKRTPATGQRFGANPANKNQSLNGSSNGPRTEIVVTPVSTKGVTVDDLVTDIELSSKDGQRKPYKICHVLLWPRFSVYTPSELRYFDYLADGRLARPQRSQTATSGFGALGGMLGSGQSLTSQASTNSKVRQEMAPWLVPLDKVKIGQPPGEPAQPYGTLDPPQFTVTTELEETGKEEKEIDVPPNRGFRKKELLLDELSTDRRVAATPGLVGTLVAWKGAVQTKKTALSEDWFRQSTEAEDSASRRAGSELSFVPMLEDGSDGAVSPNFQIVHREHGAILFAAPIRPGKTQFDRLIQFEHGKVSVNIDKSQFIALGITDKCPTLVKLNSIWPRDTETTDKEALREYSKKLSMWCGNHHLGFVSYNTATGEFRFSVSRLSKYPVAPPV